MTDSSMLRAIKFAANHDVKDGISWETDHNNELILFVVCSDFFFWGTTDSHIITDDSIDEWERAILDVSNIDPSSRGYGSLLYCCRQRSMRPQGLCYNAIPEVLWPLFDECGPERKVGLDNPKHHPNSNHTNGVAKCLMAS